MNLLRCPNCQHWRCRECGDNSRLRLRCCHCGEVSLVGQWYRGQAKGRPHDLEHSPRLGTGRPPGASKFIAENLNQFLERYDIPLNAFCRFTSLSAWAFRQARASVRPLPVMVEKLLAKTIEDIKGGKVWLRRVSRQRWDLEYVYPPYKPSCPKHSWNCQGGLLPGSCYRRWKECPMIQTDWEAVERIHEGQTKRTSVKPP